MQRKLYKVNLHGVLGTEFSSDPIPVYAKNLKDIFRALSSRFGQKFKTMVLDGAWHIIQGEKTSNEIKEDDNFISAELVDFPCEEESIHVFPAVYGSGGKGVGQIILGVILVIVAIVVIVVTWGAATPAVGALAAGGEATFLGMTASTAVLVGLSGAMMIAGGAMAMMAKNPSANYGSGGAAAQNPSFIYNGAINNTTQGVPVPLVYGLHRTGSTVISAGVDIVAG